MDFRINKYALIIILFSFFSGQVSSQVIGADITACAGTFTDSGGAGGNYSSNENLTSVICPDVAGQILCLDFTVFTVETGMDFLSLYNDDVVNAANILGSSTGMELQGTMACGSITTDNPNGCLTLNFMSDGGGGPSNLAGWEATISCLTPCTNPTAAISPSTTSMICPPSAITPGSAINFDGSGSTAAAGFSIASYNWDFGDGTTITTATPTTSYTYNVTGAYLATLTVTDDNPQGCTSTNAASTIVIVSEIPDFTGTTTTLNIDCGVAATLDGIVTSQAAIQQPPTVQIDPIGLPDGTGTAYQVPLDYTGAFPAGAVVDAICVPVLSANLEHDYVGDLTIDLVAPDGVTVRILDRNNTVAHLGECVNTDDDGLPGCTATYVFDDASATSIVGATSGTAGSPCAAYAGPCDAGATIPAGTYAPANSMAAGFAGSPLNGIWTILVTDNASSDDGSIDGAGLSFPASCYNAFIADNADINTDGTTFWVADAGNPAVVSLPAQTNATAPFTDPDPLCDNITTVDGCDGNMVTNSISVGPFSVAGTYNFTFTAEDSNGCQYQQVASIVVADVGCGVVCNPDNGTLMGN